MEDAIKLGLFERGEKAGGTDPRSPLSQRHARTQGQSLKGGKPPGILDEYAKDRAKLRRIALASNRGKRRAR